MEEIDMTFRLIMDLAEILYSVDQEDKGEVEARETYKQVVVILGVFRNTKFIVCPY